MKKIDTNNNLLIKYCFSGRKINCEDSIESYYTSIIQSLLDENIIQDVQVHFHENPFDYNKDESYFSIEPVEKYVCSFSCNEKRNGEIFTFHFSIEFQSETHNDSQIMYVGILSNNYTFSLNSESNCLEILKHQLRRSIKDWENRYCLVDEQSEYYSVQLYPQIYEVENTARYYKERMKLDLDRLLFDMRYAPENNEKIRIKAINTYFETLRVFPLEVEKKAYNHAKELFGEDAYINCHNTFHNYLDNDEIWRTGCNWWDIPRDFGHTDENISFPVRWGVMLACKNPIMFDMYYSPNSETHYDHIIEGAPYNCREFHHAFNDFYWGSSFTEPEFLKTISYLDTKVEHLDEFQQVYPKMDLLVVYGAAAQNNWYPDYAARSIWDIDGTLKIMEKCDEIWKEGYRCALVPDYAIEDGRITQKDGKIYFNGYEFSHCLFLYPKYAKKDTYDFLNKCDANGVGIAVVGKNGVDFDGNDATLTAMNFEEYSLDILEQIGCKKSAIKDGCVYEDGSFALVNKGLLDRSVTEFKFELDGKTYYGKHTGILAYRKDKVAFATKGSKLFVDDVEIDLDYI